jgi:hypothetical protein
MPAFDDLNTASRHTVNVVYLSLLHFSGLAPGVINSSSDLSHMKWYTHLYSSLKHIMMCMGSWSAATS